MLHSSSRPSASRANAGVSIAGRISGMSRDGRGELAQLKRMDEDDPGPAVFWKIMAEQNLNYGSEWEPRWALIVKGIALMTPVTGGESPSAHDGFTPVGKALYFGGASSHRPLVSRGAGSTNCSVRASPCSESNCCASSGMLAAQRGAFQLARDVAPDSGRGTRRGGTSQQHCGESRETTMRPRPQQPTHRNEVNNGLSQVYPNPQPALPTRRRC